MGDQPMHKSISSPVYQEFIALLVESRKALGYSQSQLAAWLAEPQSFVSKVESCQRRLDIVEYLLWARLLQLDTKELIGLLAEKVAQMKLPRRRARL
jgi:ribosome-binding protein aMBF1 (putative translation factor)